MVLASLKGGLMRTIRIALVGLLLSLAAVPVSASPFTAIGLPLVFGQEPASPASTSSVASQSSSLWLLVIETALEQLRLPAAPRIIIDEAIQAELFGDIAPIAPAK
jgi:hypothetical protein